LGYQVKTCSYADALMGAHPYLDGAVQGNCQPVREHANGLGSKTDGAESQYSGRSDSGQLVGRKAVKNQMDVDPMGRSA